MDVEPGIKEKATVASDSVIRAKDSGYRSVNLSKKRLLWRYKT